MNGNNITFTPLAESVLYMLLYVGVHNGRVDGVFDAYRQPPVKYSEILHRGASTTIQYKSLARGHNIQQWRKFLCSSFNKTSLIKFLVGEWKLQRYRCMLQDKALYVTCEETCFKMTADEWVDVTELQSTQEEADTCLLLHALHAARTGSKAVIVTSEDTNVMLLCLAFQNDISCPIYQK